MSAWLTEDRRPLFRAALAVAIIGTLLAAYMTYEHYTGLKTLSCPVHHHGEHSSCWDVQSSKYSRLLGIPVALLGLISYIIILGSLFLRNDYGRPLGFLFALMGFFFSLYLTYREIYTLKQICEWCVSSAVCLTILTVLTAIRLLRAPLPEPYSQSSS